MYCSSSRNNIVTKNKLHKTATKYTCTTAVRTRVRLYQYQVLYQGTISFFWIPFVMLFFTCCAHFSHTKAAWVPTAAAAAAALPPPPPPPRSIRSLLLSWCTCSTTTLRCCATTISYRRPPSSPFTADMKKIIPSTKNESRKILKRTFLYT